MSTPNDSRPFDPSLRASATLEHVLEETIAEANSSPNVTAVASELRKARVLEAESTRVQSRILFVTADSSVFTKGTLAEQTFIDLQEVFDEVHVLVIGSKGPVPTETARLAPSVWAYPLTYRFFIEIPFAAKRLVRDELEFTDGFRPDLVVALDPFESAVAAYFIADAYERPFQVHIKTDEWTNRSKFIKADRYNTWRLRFMDFVLRRAKSVRTASDAITSAVTSRFKRIPDVALLPRFFNTSQLLSLAPGSYQDQYPQFVFTIMSVSNLDAESTLFRALDAVRMSLQTPTIGFVVIGDGPLKQQFRDRAKILGIERQVIFAGAVPDYIEHLRSADVLVVTDTTAESDDVVIKAAALGVPMIMAQTPLRVDLFKDGTDAMLCEASDSLAFTEKLRTFINTNALRVQFASNSREVVRNRIEEDPQLFRIAYRDSIERMLHVDGVAPALVPPTAPQPPKPLVINGEAMKVPEE